jgi:SAM-dependent methyltransferase
VPHLTSFLASRTSARFTASSRLIATRVLPDDERDTVLPTLSAVTGEAPDLILEHPAVFFPSYPQEWCHGMLHRAASLTLDIADDLLEEGMGLKDATPYNVLYQGPVPVFIDVLSVERRRPEDSVWLAYGQFVRTFVLPLLASQCFGWTPAQVFIVRRDGLEPEDLYPLLGVVQRLLPPFLFHVTLPVWLARRAQTASPPQTGGLSASSEQATFILRRLFAHLRRTLARANKRRGRSIWSDYMATHSYGADAFQCKEKFVREAIAATMPSRVLDVGSNTGHFSCLAASQGAKVVAIDADPVAVAMTFEAADRAGFEILPLVVNLARPSPPVGWRNGECQSFLDRARGQFDLVLLLAVLHHLLVSERIPLVDVLELVSELTRSWAIVEFVGPEDGMFRRIARGREDLHRNLTQASFESACRRRFDIVRHESLPGSHRALYLLRRKGL